MLNCQTKKKRGGGEARSRGNLRGTHTEAAQLQLKREADKPGTAARRCNRPLCPESSQTGQQQQPGDRQTVCACKRVFKGRKEGRKEGTKTRSSARKLGCGRNTWSLFSRLLSFLDSHAQIWSSALFLTMGVAARTHNVRRDRCIFRLTD